LASPVDVYLRDGKKTAFTTSPVYIAQNIFISSFRLANEAAQRYELSSVCVQIPSVYNNFNSEY
jgi:hypothetical protein